MDNILNYIKANFKKEDYNNVICLISLVIHYTLGDLDYLIQLLLKELYHDTNI